MGGGWEGRRGREWEGESEGMRESEGMKESEGRRLGGEERENERVR